MVTFKDKQTRRFLIQVKRTNSLNENTSTEINIKELTLQ